MSGGSRAPVLEGRVVVVTDAEVARAVAEEGAAVILVSPDQSTDVEEVLAATLADLHAQGRRVARFVGDLDDADARAALAEMVAELFPVDDA